jgi:hypothetical protein
MNIDSLECEMDQPQQIIGSSRHACRDHCFNDNFGINFITPL